LDSIAIKEISGFYPAITGGRQLCSDKPFRHLISRLSRCGEL
jgi:hypothetical protein